MSLTQRGLNRCRKLPVMSHSKFRNKKVSLDGYTFDSLAEAKHYKYTLKPRLEAGEISHLEIHPRIRCELNGRKICDYIADFRYLNVSFAGPQGQQGDTGASVDFWFTRSQSFPSAVSSGPNPGNIWYTDYSTLSSSVDKNFINLLSEYI